jgi:hypothetical protein
MELFKPELSPEKKRKPAVWKKFEKYGKILALSALLSLPGIDSALAQDQGAEKKDLATKIEQLKEKAAASVKNMVTFVKDKGQQGKMGETPVSRHKSAEGVVTTVGFSDDRSKAEWLTRESGDGTYRYFDQGADGSLDRIIINKEEAKLGGGQKAGFNDLKTFAEIDDLAAEADVTAELDPENVKVYQFTKDGEKHFIRIVDFQSGEASELAGEDADELTAKAQGLYGKKIEESLQKTK